jgi:hypothetical protein
MNQDFVLKEILATKCEVSIHVMCELCFLRVLEVPH